MGVGALSPSLFDLTPMVGREDGQGRSLPSIRHLSGDTIRPSPNLEAGESHRIPTLPGKVEFLLDQPRHMI